MQLRHFFTMGAGADVNAFFGITTLIMVDGHHRDSGHHHLGNRPFLQREQKLLRPRFKAAPRVAAYNPMWPDWCWQWSSR
jgi:hypothetical protein